MKKLSKDLTYEDGAVLSVSRNWKERFIAEYVQTKIRYERLKTMVQRASIGKLDFTPTCPIELLNKQLGKMYEYLYILETRAIYEDIDLKNTEVEIKNW